MAVDATTLLVLRASTLGEGPVDLGEKLLALFLEKLLDGGKVPACALCLNAGVLLTTEGSPVIELMRRLEEQGCAVLSCTTCLKYFGREKLLRVGDATTMADAAKAMMEFPKVLCP